MVYFEESNFGTHSFGLKYYLIDEAIWDFDPRDHVNKEEIEAISLLFEDHSYGLKNTLCEDIEDVMDIGELQVLNTMESSFVEL